MKCERWGLPAVALVLAGCASVPVVEDRGEVIRRIVPATVQLRVEREPGVRRTASGVVVASDPGDNRTWVLTARHVLAAAGPQTIAVRAPGMEGRRAGRVVAVSDDADLALIAVDGVALPPVTLKDQASLGGDVWVVSYPWGRQLTLVSGVVSQLATDGLPEALQGPVRMVDASVSYGSSGGGVFDAATGRLVGIVEGYRTAHFKLQEGSEHTVQVPVPGETTVIPAPTIAAFLRAAGLDGRRR